MASDGRLEMTWVEPLLVRCSSTRTPTSSISTTNCTIPVRRRGVALGRMSAGVAPEGLTQHRRSQALAERGQLAEIGDGLPAGVGVALLDERQHDLFEERRLAL